MNNVLKRKAAFLVYTFLISTLISAAQAPVITSFIPLSGPIGTTVTITGSNFDPLTANNIVYFGPVKGIVGSASGTSLSVIVPAGATYGSLSVTTNGLTCHSNKGFLVTFTPGGAITPHSFVEKYDTIFHGAYGGPRMSDLDIDGKPDIILYNYTVLSIFRNTCTTTGMSFASPMELNTLPYIEDIALQDLDGDGRQDIIALIAYSNKVSVFRNTSTPGTLSFEPEAGFTTGSGPKNVISTDMDGDGKPDLIISNNGDSSVSVFRNISAGNIITFSPKVDFLVGARQRPAISDLDGDGKPDLAVANDYLNTVSLFRNTSSTGNISFDPGFDIPAGPTPFNIIIADLNEDNKPDLSVTTLTGNSFSIFKNTGTIGNISFAAKIDFAGGGQPTSRPWDISIGELDGDGKPDLFVSCDESYIYFFGSHSIFRNTSVSGNISFAPKIDPPIYGFSRGILVADVDGNGKSEIISLAVDDVQSIFRIYKNKVGEPVDTYLCPPAGNTTLTSDLSGTTYQWQVSTDSINFMNISNNNYYADVNTPSLHFNNIPSSSYGQLYRCMVDGMSSEVFGLRFRNEWRWRSGHDQWEDASGWSCGTVPDENTDVIISNGAVIILNADATIRSLTISPGASLTIGAGYNLTILH